MNTKETMSTRNKIMLWLVVIVILLGLALLAGHLRARSQVTAVNEAIESIIKLPGPVTPTAELPYEVSILQAVRHLKYRVPLPMRSMPSGNAESAWKNDHYMHRAGTNHWDVMRHQLRLVRNELQAARRHISTIDSLPLNESSRIEASRLWLAPQWIFYDALGNLQNNDLDAALTNYLSLLRAPCPAQMFFLPDEETQCGNAAHLENAPAPRLEGASANFNARFHDHQSRSRHVSAEVRPPERQNCRVVPVPA